MDDQTTTPESEADRRITTFSARLPADLTPTERLVSALLLAFEQVVDRDRQLEREVRQSVHHRIGVAHECLALGREPREVLNAVVLPLFDKGS